MKKTCYVFIISIYLSVFQVQAKTNTDSLENIVLQQQFGLSEQIEANKVLLKTFKNKNPEKHLKHAIIHKQIGVNQKIDSIEANAYIEIGRYYYKKSNTDSCKYYFNKAEKIFLKLNNTTGLKIVKTNKSNLEKKAGNFSKAISLLLEADSLNNLSYDERTAVAVHNNLGIIAQQQKNYKSAIVYYKNILAFKPEEKYIAIAYSNLSGAFMLSEKQDSAIHYALKSLEIRDRLNIKSGRTFLYNNLGAIYKEKEDFVEAKTWFNKSLKDAELNNNNYIKITALNNIGNLDVNLKNYISGEKQLLKAQKLLETNSYAKAKLYNAKYLNKLYKNTNQIEKAYGFLTLYSILKDSITLIENKTLSENFQVKYETEKYKKEKAIAKSNEIISLEKAKRSKYISIGAILFSLLIGSLLLFINSKLKLIKKQKLELDNAYEQLEESKKNELAVSNLKALQSQMNPHFIFNALNSVQDLVLLKDIRNSNKYLGKFSDLIRKILLSSKEQFISLDEEVEMLTLYLDLEKLRFGEDFIVDIKCDVSSKKQEEIELPAMFIQPYIENAIKHGLFHKEGIKKLKVYFSLKGNYLECIVEDNGIGQEKAAEFKIKRLHLHTGFSTEAINERIRLLNETLNKKIELKTEDLFDNDMPIGTKITLLFPLVD